MSVPGATGSGSTIRENTVIMKGGNYNHPVMQVLRSKKMDSGSTNKERYRISLSDGKNSISSVILTTQTNDRVGPGGIPSFSVIKIKRFSMTVISGSSGGDKRMLQILDMNIIASGDEVGEKIGSPMELTVAELNYQSSINNRTGHAPGTSTAKTSTSTSGSTFSNANVSNLSGQLIPICSLGLCTKRWFIKARVTKKSAIRTWSNWRGEGIVFSVDLLDESGEIQVAAFEDKFYNYIQEDKVYHISKCDLKPANKEFNKLGHDYQMTMNAGTTIQECKDVDNVAIPNIKYDFITIEQIATVEENTLIDVAGVVKSVGDLKTSRGELKRREIILVDQTRTAVSLTLWRSETKNFDGFNHPVLIIKRAKVKKYEGGTNLSVVSSTRIKINPEIMEWYRLRSWYDGEGKTLDFTNISTRWESVATPWSSFKEAQDRGLGNAEKSDYYQVMGTILLLGSENVIYKACPTEECKNKKVIDIENGMYLCEKCSREYPNFKYCLVAHVNVADWTSNQWVSMFGAEVEKALGITALEVGGDPEAMPAIADKASFKQFIMKCRSKMKMYNGEARSETVCYKLDPINYEEYNAHLIERIQQLTAQNT